MGKLDTEPPTADVSSCSVGNAVKQVILHELVDQGAKKGVLLSSATSENGEIKDIYSSTELWGRDRGRRHGSEEGHSISGVHAMSQSKAARKIWVDVLLNGKPIKMELDTGASISLINHKLWKETLASIPLKESKVVLRAYTGHQLPVLGQTMVSVEVDGQVKNLPLVVTKGSGPPLLGRNWLSEISLNWGRLRDHFIQQISAGACQKSQGVSLSTPLKLLLKEFSDLFQKGLGEMGKLKARIFLKKGASPKFFKPRAVPYALKEKIEEDLKRLEHLGVISQICHSEWQHQWSQSSRQVGL